MGTMVPGSWEMKGFAQKIALIATSYKRELENWSDDLYTNKVFYGVWKTGENFVNVRGCDGPSKPTEGPGR